MRRWLPLITVVVVLLGSVVRGNPLARGADLALRPTVAPEVQAQLTAGKSARMWVRFAEEADLTPAFGMHDWAARGQFVYDRLTATARHSQAQLRTELDRRGTTYTAYWIVNAVQVTGDQALLDAITAVSGITAIESDMTHALPAPIPGTAEPTIGGLEWNIADINADDVWAGFGDRGEGITVATIDTGVQFDHPALVTSYRGNLGNGTFDHNYNWYDADASVDASGECVYTPCDDDGHGTHTMGTMVGDDGAGNQIGVAPGVRWMAARGFGRQNWDLLGAMQWMLAPTRLDGSDPRPDLRPQIVNNSWGQPGTDTTYASASDAWVAAGIMPIFANGNEGPSCATSESPATYLTTYAIGAYDSTHAIADFSSRGPSPFGSEVKPNLSAPGVNIRSSVGTNGYVAFSGTSMAAPHAAATVALLWSAAPALIGDVAATRSILDATAMDMNDTTCGGTATDNNVWGEGRLDALAAVTQAPRTNVGTLRGQVTAGGAPLGGVQITLTGPTSRTVFSDPTGAYLMRVPAGTYTITAARFGYVTSNASATVTAGTATTRDVTLTNIPRFTLSGVVRTTTGLVESGVLVSVPHTPLTPTRTDASGAYTFTGIPQGTYQVQVADALCAVGLTRSITITAPKTLNIALTPLTDGVYSCSPIPANYVQATNPVTFDDGDDGATAVTLPFAFPFYGATYTSGYIVTNGFLDFAGPSVAYTNAPLLTNSSPNGIIAPFWDDLVVTSDPGSGVFTQTRGTAPNRSFVVEWRQVHWYTNSFDVSTNTVDVELILFESGRIVLQYRHVDPNDEVPRGGSATVGIESASGTRGLQASFNQPVLSDRVALQFDTDLTPPSTSATVTPAPNATGWNRANPTVTLAASDNTAGIRKLTYSATGAQPMGATSVNAATTSFTISAQGTTTITYVAVDTAGNTESPKTLVVKLDTTAPTMSRGPQTQFVTGARVGTATLPVTVFHWLGADTGGSGLASYLIQQSSNGAAYTTLPLPSALATSFTQDLTPGSSYRYQVRARDGAGNRSAFARGASVTVDAVDDVNGAIAYATGWTRRSQSYAYGGTVRYATAASSTATLSFSGTRVAWVSTKGTDRGQARVRIDGGPAVIVDLYASALQSRRIVYSVNGLSSGTHTLTITVLSTRNPSSTGTRVDIDLFGVLR